MATPVTFTAPGATPAVGGGAPANLQRAYLEMREPPADGSTANPSGQVLGTVRFQFNPRELTLAKNATWKRDTQRNASKSAPPEFTGSEPSKLALEIFLDATENMDDKVVKTVEKLFSCCVPTARSRQGKKGSPPWVIFHWGGLTSFPAYVSSVSAKYTLFTPGGTPVRALCSVTLEEISGEQSGQNPTSGALAARDVHVVVAGDTLPSVAFQAYGDAGMWREIARLNEVDDPLRLRPGGRLLIPAAEELAPRHGE